MTESSGLSTSPKGRDRSWVVSRSDTAALARFAPRSPSRIHNSIHACRSSRDGGRLAERDPNASGERLHGRCMPRGTTSAASAVWILTATTVRDLRPSRCTHPHPHPLSEETDTAWISPLIPLPCPRSIPFRRASLARGPTARRSSITSLERPAAHSPAARSPRPRSRRAQPQIGFPGKRPARGASCKVGEGSWRAAPDGPCPPATGFSTRGLLERPRRANVSSPRSRRFKAWSG